MSEPNETDPEEPPEPEARVHLHVPDTAPPLTGWLAEQTTSIMRLAAVERGGLDISVVDDQRMSSLHQDHLGIAETTDVLTFDLRERQDDPVLGDIVVCLDEAERQATHRGHDTRLEVLLYCVHGLLHLIGYDDKTQEAADRMHEQEDALLTQAGFGPVFDQRATTTRDECEPGPNRSAANDRGAKTEDTITP